VVSTLNAPVIALDGVSHCVLRGLIIETCCQQAIRMQGGAHNQIAACTIRNTGLNGVVVEDGSYHEVVACELHDTGQAGLRIGGARGAIASWGIDKYAELAYRYIERGCRW